MTLARERAIAEAFLLVLDKDTLAKYLTLVEPELPTISVAPASLRVDDVGDRHLPSPARCVTVGR